MTNNDTQVQARIHEAAAFLYWLQRHKRFYLGGHQKPDDFLRRRLRPVSTPAKELIAEYIGDDLPMDDLPDETVLLLNELRPPLPSSTPEIDKSERARQ